MTPRPRHTVPLYTFLRSLWPHRKTKEDQMPDNTETIDQADAAKTLAEVADDNDVPAPGIAAVREDLSGMTAVVDAAGGLGSRTLMEAFVKAKEEHRFSVSYDEGEKGEVENGLSSGGAYFKAKEEYERRLWDEDKLAIAASDAVTLADPPKSAEEIEKILFDGPAAPAGAGMGYPARDPYAESEEQKAERLEKEEMWRARDTRTTALHIVARMHQGRGLNMRDFLDEAEVIAEYITEGYIEGYEV